MTADAVDPDAALRQATTEVQRAFPGYGCHRVTRELSATRERINHKKVQLRARKLMMVADLRPAPQSHQIVARCGRRAPHPGVGRTFLPSVLSMLSPMRSRLLTALVLIAAPACSTPTMIAPRVSLAIEQVALSADGRHIGYQYTITNPSADTVWIPACGGVIRPDVSVVIGGQHTDTYSGSLCLANVDMGPAPVPPGGRYAGQSSVQVATGASFVPYIVVSLRRTPGGPARKVSGAAFNAP